MQAPTPTRAPSTTATMSADSSSSRRSTISAISNLYPRSRKSGGNGQCTHLTTTRLFTNEFRCGVCLREGSYGWLYRCTQDRELMIEEDLENGSEDNLDALCTTLPRSNQPRKRSAAARSSKLSFLDEISSEDLKTYTPTQLNQILTQRAHLLDILLEPDPTDFPSFAPTMFYTMPFDAARPLPPLPSPGQNTANPPLGFPDNIKPWFPLKGGECQFKCCHTCRPTLQDRSYLSLNGIANGDIPATAITGFGFHLGKQRPVALVETVAQLGLRKSPVPQPLTEPDTPERPVTPRPTTTPFLRRRPNNIGLGIFPQEPFPQTPSSQPPGVAASPSPAHTPTIRLVPGDITPLQTFVTSLPAPSNNTSTRRHTVHIPSSSAHKLATSTPLPPPTPSEERARGVVESTPMEKSEEEACFGAAPLEVKDGVAVTEEAVELHVPDVITQF